MKHIKHFFSSIGCLINLHHFKIFSLNNKKGFARICKTCDKKQYLKKLSSSPTRFIWMDEKIHKI